MAKVIDNAKPLLSPLVKRATDRLGGILPGGQLPMSPQSERGIQAYEAGTPGYQLTGPNAPPIQRKTIIDANYRRLTTPGARRVQQPRSNIQNDPALRARTDEADAMLAAGGAAKWKAMDAVERTTLIKRHAAKRDAKLNQTPGGQDIRESAIRAVGGMAKWREFDGVEKATLIERHKAKLETTEGRLTLAQARIDEAPKAEPREARARPPARSRAEVREETNRNRIARGYPPLGKTHEEYRQQQAEDQAAAQQQQAEIAELDRRDAEKTLFNRRMDITVESRERELKIKKAESSMDDLRGIPESTWKDEDRALFAQNETNLKQWYREAAMAEAEIAHEDSETKKGDAYTKVHGQPYTRQPFQYGTAPPGGVPIQEPVFGADMQTAMAAGARGAAVPAAAPQAAARQPAQAPTSIGQRARRAGMATGVGLGQLRRGIGEAAGQVGQLAGAAVSVATRPTREAGEALSGFMGGLAGEQVVSVPGFGEVQDATFTPQGLDVGVLPDGREIRGATLNGLTVYVIFEPGGGTTVVDANGAIVQR